MCGLVDPSDNRMCIRFPDGFCEVKIDEISYQHAVMEIDELAVGDHIRFRISRTQVWRMGWVRRKSARSIWVQLTCETDCNHTQRFIFRLLSNVTHVPMIPEDIIEKEFDGDLGWSSVDGSPGMIPFIGNGEIFLEKMSSAATYWAQFVHGKIDLLKDHYQKGTNIWAARRKEMAI